MVEGNAMLKQALKLLASPATEQVAWLLEIGVISQSDSVDPNCNVDEIGLQFEDALICPLDNFTDQEIMKKIKEIIFAIDEIMLQNSGKENAEFWSIHGLYTDDRWKTIRILSIEALFFLK
jgi:hypothetical protein